MMQQLVNESRQFTQQVTLQRGSICLCRQECIALSCPECKLHRLLCIDQSCHLGTALNRRLHIGHLRRLCIGQRDRVCIDHHRRLCIDQRDQVGIDLHFGRWHSATTALLSVIRN